jgi:hypothetical protein
VEFQHDPVPIPMPYPEWRLDVVRHIEADERIMGYAQMLVDGLDERAGLALREGILKCTNSYLP